jgi:hypothetical protein
LSSGLNSTLRLRLTASSSPNRRRSRRRSSVRCASCALYGSAANSPR